MTRIVIKKDVAKAMGQTQKIEIPRPLAEDAPFRNVEHALRFAYNMEGRDVLKVATFFKQLKSSEIYDSDNRPSSVPDFRDSLKDLSSFEIQAQAAMILSFVRNSLSDKLYTFVAAYFTIDDTIRQPDGTETHGPLYNRKTFCCRYLAGKFLTDTLPYDKGFMADAVRHYCGMKPEHEWRYWMHRLNVSESKLWRWIRSNETRHENQSVHYVLKGIESAMRTNLANEMREVGLVS